MAEAGSRRQGPAGPARAQDARAQGGAVPSGAADRRNADRRAEPRRSAGGRRRRTQPSVAVPYFLVSREWILMAPAFAAAILLLALGSWSLPSVFELGLAGLAIAVAATTPLLVRIERQHTRAGLQRQVILALAVGLPMALFGLAVALWAASPGGPGWQRAVGVLVMVGAAGAMLLHGRLPSIVAAKVALWSGVAGVVGSTAAWTVLAAGGIACSILAERQSRMAQRDAERRREAERAQARAEEILSDYEQTGQGWFWETDRRGMLIYVSPTIGRVLGVQPGKLIGKPFSDLFILDGQDQERERTLVFHLSARSSFQDLAVRAATEKEERWWSISGRPVHDEFNNFLGFRGSGSDLTERRRSQEVVTRLAHYDSLTGLANRLQMSETLEKILNAPREDQRSCAVFLLDLDRFKQVNDTLGHPAGDALLKQVAQRLECAVDKAGRVGRLGGDEFQVILPGRLDRTALSSLAEQIIESLSQPYSIEGHRVMIGASVGIALAPDDGVTSEAIIRNSDLALYAAKDGGRGRHHFYAPDLHEDAEERRQLEQDLRDAIAGGGLELHYQPSVQTTTERITGFEALLRWNHPRLGMLSPTRFVPVAEEAGLIAQIGEWALRTACRDLAKWPESVRVAVNVSPLQFANPALPAIVVQALASAGVSADRLELEITESVFLNDNAATEAMFSALKRVGVRLALDDFGTGYSSLGYLRKAPFDKIKIDQSFVRGATIKGSRNGAIIASIVSLAEALDMETTAEGVETLDELDLVRALGCSHVQGYIYEKPLPAAMVADRLTAGLQVQAVGFRSARAARRKVLRRVVLEHGGEQYEGTLRNVSENGAMIEGLWNVPSGTGFSVHLADGYVVGATTRWCSEGRIGVEFAVPVQLSGVAGLRPANEALQQRPLRRRTG